MLRVGRNASSAGTLSTFATTAVAASSAPGWTLTLERGIGKSYGAEAELQATGAFAAEVFPDLPIATTWQNLAKALTGRLTSSAAAEPSPPFTHYTTRPGALKVITTAANLRTEHELEMRILQAAGEGASACGGQRAEVLLCVSGSHPVRTLPLVSRFLRSSLDTLRVAQRLKQQGYISPSTQLWVVANPNTERSAALLEAKAALGASAVLTQPPFDWPAYLAWLDDAERRGLLRPAAPRPAPTPPPVSPSRPPEAVPSARDAADQADPSTMALASTTIADTELSGGVAASTADSDREEADGNGRVRLLVGHPVISSMANLSFWVTLSGCGSSSAVQRLVAEAARAEVEGAAAAAKHAMAYNQRLVRQVLERGGVAGMHVMPITKSSKKMAIQMLEEGILSPSES